MNAKTLRIGQLHYHFQRCGVRTVIENLLRGLIAYSSFVPVEFDLIYCELAGGACRVLHNAVMIFRPVGVNPRRGDNVLPY